jgi:hypothetical protein
MLHLAGWRRTRSAPWAPSMMLQAKLVRVGGSLGGAKPKALIEIAGEQWECIIGFRNADSRGRAATK